MSVCGEGAEKRLIRDNLLLSASLNQNPNEGYADLHQPATLHSLCMRLNFPTSKGGVHKLRKKRDG